MSTRIAYSLKDAAQAVGLSVRSLRYLVQSGKLGYVRVGRRILIREDDLQRLLKQGYCRPQGRMEASDSIRPRKQEGLGRDPEALDDPC
jgi:excisionase family DNA binding protein